MSEKPKSFFSDAKTNPNYTGFTSPEVGLDVIGLGGLPSSIAAEKLHQKLIFDELTGCYNQNYFEIFKREHRKRRGSQKDFNHIGLVIADLNDLKGINDSLGHQAGNQALKDASIFMKAISREGDILARIGGDEFVLVCFNHNNHEDFEEALTARMTEKFSKAPVSMAFGCAVYDGREHISGLDATQDVADSRMYADKCYIKSHSNGKNI